MLCLASPGVMAFTGASDSPAVFCAGMVCKVCGVMLQLMAVLPTDRTPMRVVLVFFSLSNVLAALRWGLIAIVFAEEVAQAPTSGAFAAVAGCLCAYLAAMAVRGLRACRAAPGRPTRVVYLELWRRFAEELCVLGLGLLLLAALGGVAWATGGPGVVWRKLSWRRGGPAQEGGTDSDDWWSYVAALGAVFALLGVVLLFR